MDGGGGCEHELTALPTTSQEVEAAKKEEEQLCREAAEVKVWSISILLYLLTEHNFVCIE